MESASVPSPRAPPGLTTSVEFERRLNRLEELRFGASVPSFQERLLELDTLRWHVQREERWRGTSTSVTGWSSAEGPTLGLEWEISRAFLAE